MDRQRLQARPAGGAVSAGHGDADRWPSTRDPRRAGYLEGVAPSAQRGNTVRHRARDRLPGDRRPDEDGGFLALDSDGVECRFHVLAVVCIER